MLPDDHQLLPGVNKHLKNLISNIICCQTTISNFEALKLSFKRLRRLTPSLEKWLDEAQKKVIFLTTAAQPVNLLQQQKSMKIADNVRQQFPQPWTYDGLAHHWKIVVN